MDWNTKNKIKWNLSQNIEIFFHEMVNVAYNISVVLYRLHESGNDLHHMTGYQDMEFV